MLKNPARDESQAQTLARELEQCVLNRIKKGYEETILPVPPRLMSNALLVNTVVEHAGKIQVTPHAERFLAIRQGKPLPQERERLPRGAATSAMAPDAPKDIISIESDDEEQAADDVQATIRATHLETAAPPMPQPKDGGLAAAAREAIVRSSVPFHAEPARRELSEEAATAATISPAAYFAQTDRERAAREAAAAVKRREAFQAAQANQRRKTVKACQEGEDEDLAVDIDSD